MKTKNTLLFSAIITSAALFGLSSAVFAQGDAQSKPPAKQSKAVKKSHKVWSDEDFPSSRSAAGANSNQSVPAADSQQPATTSQNAGSQQRKGGGPPVFTNPKSLEEADKMIAWEGRDIGAQEEFLERVRRQIDDAPADQKERLTKLFQERKQILANTRNELKNLETQKKELEKPPAATQTASTDPPSN